MAGVALEGFAGAAAQQAVRGSAAVREAKPVRPAHALQRLLALRLVSKCWKCSNNDIPRWNWIRFMAMAGSVGWWTCEQSAPFGGSFRKPGGRFYLIRNFFRGGACIRISWESGRKRRERVGYIQ